MCGFGEFAWESRLSFFFLYIFLSFFLNMLLIVISIFLLILFVESVISKKCPNCGRGVISKGVVSKNGIKYDKYECKCGEIWYEVRGRE